MKKFFGYLLLIVSILIITVVSVPFNNISQWGFELPFLTTYELLIKAIIGGFSIVLGVVFFFVSNKQYKEDGSATNCARNLAVIPMFTYSIAAMTYTGFLALQLYRYFITTQIQLFLFIGSIGIVLALFVIGYILIMEYKKTSSLGRLIRSLILFASVLATAAFSYVHLIYRVGDNYPLISTSKAIFAVPFVVVIIFVYLILGNLIYKKTSENEQMEKELKGENSKEKTSAIVSKEQPITTKENIDPTDIVFADVAVDPEFSKMASVSNQPNSIEYYIEKPKMFKPLNPTFDELVAYVRELPQVVTKLDDDRVTFYVDRKPFLVLMNFGNYYRMAFKYDLEQGIRLIIKYPTISKNKSTKDELWFKANNYGDIPKEVIYSIVKTAHNNFSN